MPFCPKCLYGYQGLTRCPQCGCEAPPPPPPSRQRCSTAALLWLRAAQGAVIITTIMMLYYAIDHIHSRNGVYVLFLLIPINIGLFVTFGLAIRYGKNEPESFPEKSAPVVSVEPREKL